MREKARDCCIWFNIVKALEDSSGVGVHTERHLLLVLQNLAQL